MVETITIPHLGRVEGHGGIHVTIADGAVTDVDMDIHEGSRYYEQLLVGKNHRDVQGIITRVCAICSADHTVAALEALEQALGVEVSTRARLLRGLLLRGAAIESHALHVFALALPDFLGFDSVMAMAGRYPSEVAFALELKQLGNRLQTVIGGRAVHPINTLVGGFGTMPSRSDVAVLRSNLDAVLEPLSRTVDLMASIEVPVWAEHPTLFVALRPHGEGFGFRGEVLCTSKGAEHPVAAYHEAVREFTVEHSTARHAALASGETYMVGSLARLALWGDRLEGAAAAARDRLFPAGIPDNVLLNTRAQLVEIVYSVDSAIELCDGYLETPEIEAELREIEVRRGRGVSAIEAPRGTLVHDYELDDDGIVTAANIITPTAQNLANVERDLREAGKRLQRRGHGSEAELKHAFEMLARAYDPCISCSVHVACVAPDHLPATESRAARGAAVQRALVLGLGNPAADGDGVGHGVIRRLAEAPHDPSVRLHAVDGDLLGLAEIWRGEEEIWLVDAVATGRPPGSLVVVDNDLLLRPRGEGAGSAHHIDLGESLKWLLHARPELRSVRFRLYGVEIGGVDPNADEAAKIAEGTRRLAELLSGAAATSS